MQISVAKSNSNTKFLPQTVDEFNRMEELILNHTYSCAIFKDNYRNNENFQAAECIALDFDDGMTIGEAALAFSRYKHIIATTRNHQKEKKGKVADRFRVILFLTAPITDQETYTATYKSFIKQYPMADKTIDPGRMFYPSQSIYSSKDGETVDPVAATPKEITVKLTDEIDYGSIPDGWSNCKWAIANGYFEAGEGNEAMMSLCSMFKKLKYSQEQAYYMCKNALKKRFERTGAKYDDDELWREVVTQVYSTSWKGAVYVCSEPDTWLHNYCNSLGVHACAKESTGFDFCSLDELFTKKHDISWCVDGLFSEGGASILVGKPKSGKSTLARQLALNVSRGSNFLGRSTNKGRVMYVALEEQAGMLKRQLVALGATKDDDLLLHVGATFSSDPLKDLENQIERHRPKLVVIDTLLLLIRVDNDNSYNEMNKVLAKLRDVARTTGAHIICLHHQNKPHHTATQNRGAESIMGSSAIHGAMDTIMVFNKIGHRRVINTEGRGLTNFTGQELEFDAETETYKLGVKHDEF